MKCATHEDNDGTGYCVGCGVTIGEPHHSQCDQTVKKIRYRFYRYRKNVLMAEGIAVHASSMRDAIKKAESLKYAPDERLEFFDNSPCAKGVGCADCNT